MSNVQQKLNEIIHGRFIDLMISEKVAKQRLGLISEKKTVSANRNLLSIEERAQELKERKIASEIEFAEYINEYFHDALFDYAEHRLTNAEYLFSELLKIDSDFAKTIDVCLSKAGSAKQLAELIAPNPALKRELLNLVNKPPFREKDSTRPFQEDVSLAIRYVGLENIKTPIVALIIKQWLPHSTDPFTDFKSSLWRYTIATANCMEALAEQQGLNPFHAYVLGLLQGLGYGLSLRLYIRSFDRVRIQEMHKARESGRHDIEKQLNNLEHNGQFASDLTRYHGLTVSKLLVEELKLKFAALTPALDPLLDNVAIADMPAMSQCLNQAKGYVQYKFLQKARLIELPEAKRFLSGLGLNNEKISVLNQVELGKLSRKNHQ
jgi:hypothetical protein